MAAQGRVQPTARFEEATGSDRVADIRGVHYSTHLLGGLPTRSARHPSPQWRGPIRATALASMAINLHVYSDKYSYRARHLD